MKHWLIALAMVAGSAQAVDCNRPLSGTGYAMLSQYWYYTYSPENKQQIDNTMEGFCELGKSYRDKGLPDPEVQARLYRESGTWVNSVLADQIAHEPTRDGIAAILYLAGYSGYTGRLWPLEATPEEQAKAKKRAAAMKAERDQQDARRTQRANELEAQAKKEKAENNAMVDDLLGN